MEHGEETSALVGEALRAGRRRALLQDGSIAAALALLALGLPLERLLGRAPRFDERLGFLLSALCFALGWLVLARAARRNAWESGPVLRAGLIAASAPVVLFAATTPGPAAAGWLGACLVLAALVSESATPLLRTVAWAGAALLHPWNVWLWPAWLVRERRGRVWCIGAGLAAGILFRPRELLAGLDGGPGPCAAWWTLWIAGLGGAALGLVALRRSPPLWIVAFALGPLVPLSLGGTIGYDLPWIWLAPLGWLGALELEKRGRRTGILLAGSLACAAAALCWIRATDPERAWRAAAEEQLEPQDLVLTLSPEHAYLLGKRYGLRVVLYRGTSDADEQVAMARASGQRVVLDATGLEGIPEAVRRELESRADARLPAR